VKDEPLPPPPPLRPTSRKEREKWGTPLRFSPQPCQPRELYFDADVGTRPVLTGLLAQGRGEVS
jgi:hypothetical protein